MSTTTLTDQEKHILWHSLGLHPSEPWKKLVSFRGKTQTMAMWDREMGLPPETVWQRMVVCGWSAQKAISTPLRTTVRKKKQ